MLGAPRLFLVCIGQHIELAPPACSQAGMSCLNHWIPAFAGMTFLLNARLHLSPAGHENEWLKSLILKAHPYATEHSNLFRVCLTIILQIIGITLF